ncbi:GyrI-like domain-containing protein [Bacillus cereus]|uniref:GyrI-like domain-containing protein n=1 Tax=Bacillus cereus TaxID=1396 RepID=UPI00211378AE|nr:GyrI-like domain-containing protein [Bacillus cereus]MCQ6343592.1 GyrI-like domain-containing protein [Bacillus cereus]
MSLHLDNLQTSPTIIKIAKTSYITIEQGVRAGSIELRHALTALTLLSMEILKNTTNTTTISPLEGAWFEEDQSAHSWEESLLGKMMMQQPTFITEKIFHSAKKSVLSNLTNPEIQSYIHKAYLKIIEARFVVQMLHIGPYENEPPFLRKMIAYAETQGFIPTSNIHHEVYLKDIRTVSSDKYETILRIPLQKNIAVN